MAKLELVLDYAENHTADITASAEAWTGMLDTAAQLYRYSFADLVLIHAQRPDATALADFDTWNKRMGRRIKRGAKGIGVLREKKDGRPVVRHLFDIADTWMLPGGRSPQLWHIDGDNERAAEEYLRAEYAIPQEKNGIPDLLREIAGTMLPKEATAEEAAFIRSSIEYVLLKRCGYDPRRFMDTDYIFTNVRELGDDREIMRLGSAVMEAAEPVLYRLGYYLRTNKSIKEEDNHNGKTVDLSLGGRRTDSGSGSSADAAGDREVRHDEETVPAREPQEHVQPDASGGNASGSSAGRAGQSDTDDGGHAAENDGGRGSDGGTESGRHDGVGRQGELDQGEDRGDHQGADDLHITAEQPPQINFAAAPVPEAYKTHNLTGEQREALEAILRHGGGRDRSRLRIAYEYMSEPDPEARARFLREEIRACTKGVIVNGRHYAAAYSEAGLKFIEGESVKDKGFGAVSLSWEEVESGLYYLFNRGAFASQMVLDTARKNAIQEAANAYVEMQRELDKEVREEIFGEDVLGKYVYPEVREKAFDSLKDPEILERIYEKVRKTEEAYREDPDIIRFKIYRPAVILKHLDRIRRFSLNLYADPEADVALADEFITDDQVNDYLSRRGSGVSNGDLRTYAFFKTNQDPEERVRFLRAEYGNGGCSNALPDIDNISEDHDSKGIVLGVNKYRSYTGRKKERLIRYPEAARRIQEMIDREVFLSDEAKAKLGEYERFVMAGKIISFYNGLPWKVDRPWSKEDDVVFGYGNGRTKLQDRLENRTEAEKLLGVMDLVLASLPEETRNLQEKTEDLAMLHRYVSGEYSIYQPEKLAAPRGRQLSLSDMFAFDDAGENDQRAHEETRAEEAPEAKEPLPELDQLTGDIISLAKEVDPYDFADEVNSEAEAADELKKDLTEGKTDGYIEALQFVADENEDRATVEKARELIDRVNAWSGRKKDGTAGDTEEPEEPGQEARNYRIDNDSLGVGTPKERFRRNMEAIRLLKDLEGKKRKASPEEQEVLAGYVGWGGLADAFDEGKPGWKKEAEELKELLTDQEYKDARASTLTSFYTPPAVIRSVYATLARMGFKNGNILEPSCGTGNFFGMMPEGMAETSNTYGVELDSLSGRIAKQLYPENHIAVTGFERTKYPDNFFDLAIGNVPFGQYTVPDKRYDRQHMLVHDYFIAKMLDQVRPGGIVAVVTSSGTMDKANDSARRYYAERADLLGAVRLPNTVFRAAAGTEAVTDILFFKRRESGPARMPEWTRTEKNIKDDEPIREGDRIRTEQTFWRVIDGNYQQVQPEGVVTKISDYWGGRQYVIRTDDGTEHNVSDRHQLHILERGGLVYDINSYFKQHPEMILGEYAEVSGPYGPTATGIERPGRDLEKDLKEALEKIEGSYEEARIEGGREDADETETLPADPAVRNYSYTEVDGGLYYRQDSIMVRSKLSDEDAGRMRGLMGIRDALRAVLDAQLQGVSDAELTGLQETLNRAYDAFVERFGRLSLKKNQEVFHEDSAAALLLSLEKYDDRGEFAGKADVFSRRTIRKSKTVDHVDTAGEALALSIAEKAGVDLTYMSRLTGLGEEDIKKDLRGVIFKDPTTGSWLNSDEYLSGNVRVKLRDAEEAAKEDPEYQVNVEHLSKVQPKDLEASEINVRLGATWIKPEYIENFMGEVLNTPDYLLGRVIGIDFAPQTGLWRVHGKTKDSFYNTAVTSTYGTSRRNGYQILEDALNLKDSKVYDLVQDADGNEKRVLNKQETLLVQQKQDLLREAFRDWIFKDIARREDIVKTYNWTFNAIRPREYDGSHIVLDGITNEIKLRPHQMNAIAHMLYGDNTLLAHVVGAGKTFSMVAAGMESKRLGLSHKALYVVPNHLTEQWGADFQKLYPGANVLVATKKDFEKDRRKRFCAKIATGDYDAVIIGHSQFEKIPLSPERQLRYVEDEVEELAAAIDEIKASSGRNYTVKQLESMKRKLQANIEKLKSKVKQDDVVTFEELGVDRLFIDEAHAFKNVAVYTKMNNIAGISTTGAGKSQDLMQKCRYMDEQTGGKGIVFATGTPVSNSMTEMYTMMRYLQKDQLKETGLTAFDAWASSFGETLTSVELAPEGTGYRAKTRFSRFFNLPELISIFKMSADIQTADMLNLPVPEAEYINEVLKPSEIQKEMVKSFGERAERVRNGGVDASVDNMLKITNDGRKAALDQRLINPELPDDPGSKVTKCAENVFKVWEETKPDHLTQMVFCDLSTPKPGVFNVYDDLREKLVEKGIPKEEVAFIHEYETEKKKEELFKKVRTGKVRVLIGSTSKLGAGTNVQDKLVAMHHLDCPWRPADLEQQEGRILRQGNQNEKVKIYRYVTEGTFDAYMWQTLENKQKFISQIMTSKSPARQAEDIDGAALNYAEIKALCTGNPYIKEKMDLDIQITKLRLLRSNYMSDRYRIEDAIAHRYPLQIASEERIIKALKEDSAVIQAAMETEKASDSFEMTVAGKIYTDKEEAGEALRKAAREMAEIHSDAVIGQYHGFNITSGFDSFSKLFKLDLKGAMTYTIVMGESARGNIQRIQNGFSEIPDLITQHEQKLSAIREQMKEAEETVKKPWPFESEFQEKVARQAELNALLDIDKKDYDAIGMETDDEGAGNTAETVKEPPVAYETKRKGEKMSLGDIKALAASRRKRVSKDVVDKRPAYGRA